MVVLVMVAHEAREVKVSARSDARIVMQFLRTTAQGGVEVSICV